MSAALAAVYLCQDPVKDWEMILLFMCDLYKFVIDLIDLNYLKMEILIQIYGMHNNKSFRNKSIK